MKKIDIEKKLSQFHCPIYFVSFCVFRDFDLFIDCIFRRLLTPSYALRLDGYETRRDGRELLPNFFSSFGPLKAEFLLVGMNTLQTI